MRVLMLSLDRGLLGSAASGDVIARHQAYADKVGHLDVIVFAKEGAVKEISPNLRIFPTNSGKFNHFKKSVEITLKLGKQGAYDLLVSQDFAAPAVARIKKLLRVPWIVNVHGMFFSSEWLSFSPAKWYLYRRIRAAIKTADGFRVNNTAIKATLQNWGLKSPILVQPTPVDVSKFRSFHKPANLVPKLVYVGRLSPEKNVKLLISTIRSIVDNLELDIVGSGPEEEGLKNLAQADHRIKFTGPKSHDELAAIYQQSDILVLPSDTESYGKVLVEAGAAGCALVATRTAGAASIIEDGKNGILVPIGDSKALKNAFEKLIHDSALRLKLQHGAREMTERYDFGKAVENTVGFWREIANK